MLLRVVLPKKRMDQHLGFQGFSARHVWTAVVSLARNSGANSFQVRDSFKRQGIMKLLGARISRIDRGIVEISARNRPQLSQQDGFVHAGALASLADSAGGYATLSLLPKGSRVLSVEFKLNFLKPALGDTIRARGRVLKTGKTIAVAEWEVQMRNRGAWTTCAWGSQTIYCIRPKGAPAAN